MVYYRTDLLQKLGKQPPKTWDDYLDIAKAAQGKDLNGDGKPDYGSCISKKRNAQAYWVIISHRRRLPADPRAPSQGVFFDTDQHEAADQQRRLPPGPPGLPGHRPSTGRPTRSTSTSATRAGSFTSGRCALTLDWGDIGTLADRSRPTSKVQDKVGAVILPGSTQVLDRATGKLVACDAKTCPYAIDGVNHAPFAAFGGWSGGINAQADRQGEGCGLRLPLLHEPSRRSRTST